MTTPFAAHASRHMRLQWAMRQYLALRFYADTAVDTAAGHLGSGRTGS